MKKLLLILLLFPIFVLAQNEEFLPKIAWSTNLLSVQFVSTDTYRVDVFPLNNRDPGASPVIYGNWLADNRGYRYEIIDTTGAPTIIVIDNGLGGGYAPASNRIGYVYKSAGNGYSPSLPTFSFEKLQRRALEFGYGIDMDIIWTELLSKQDTMPFTTLLMDTTYIPSGNETKGDTYWDNDNNTMSTVMGNGVIYQWAKEAYIDGQNDTGVEIPNGTPVMYAGSIGNSGNFRIELGIASSTSPAFLFIGVTTELILDGEVGKITTRGKARGIQTDGGNYGEVWSAGDIVYESGVTAGYLTNVAPQAPIPAIPVALVISAHATNGTLEVRPTFPQKLTELSDVDGTPLDSTGQFPVWNNDSSYFDFDYNINDYFITASDTLPASQVSIVTGIGSPTVDQVQEYMDNIGSSGFFLGGELSDGGVGTLDIAAGQGFIRTINDENAELQSFKWSASAGIAVTDNTTQYAYVDDTGVISLSTNEFLEAPDLIQIGVVTKEGGVVDHTFGLGVRLQESIGNAGRFIRRVHGIARDKRKGGLIFGQSGDANRDVSITAGVLWWGRTQYPIPAFNTSGSDVFNTYSAGGLEDAGATAWPNEQYDNGGTLTALGNNKWANLFFFIEPDGHIDMVYGRAQFNSEAIADFEGVPNTSLPSRISQTSILAARFTFKKSSNTATISSAFEQLFANAGVTSHPDLAVLDFASSGHTGFEQALTFSAGLTRTTNTITTNDSEIDHNGLLNYAIGQHRIINDAGTSATELWSASKINIEIGNLNIGNLTDGFIPNATGTALEDGPMFTDGTNISLGSTSTAGKFRVTTGAGDNLIYADDYSSNAGHTNYWFSRRSASNNIGTSTTTVNGTILGAFYFQGVNNANAFAYGAKINAIQTGTAGTFVPTNLIFNTYSSTAINDNQLVLSNTGSISMSGALDVTGVTTTDGVTTSSTILMDNNVFMKFGNPSTPLYLGTGADLLFAPNNNEQYAVLRGYSGAILAVGGNTGLLIDNSLDATFTGTVTHLAPTLSTESALLDDIEGGTRDGDFATLAIAGVPVTGSLWTDDLSGNLYPTNDENIIIGNGTTTTEKSVVLQRGIISDGSYDIKLANNSTGVFQLQRKSTGGWVTLLGANVGLNPNVVLYYNGSPRLTTANTGITLSAGATVDEFSTDGTLSGNSDSDVPTEKAVKTYVDAQVGGLWQDLTGAIAPETITDAVRIGSVSALGSGILQVTETSATAIRAESEFRAVQGDIAASAGGGGSYAIYGINQNTAPTSSYFGGNFSAVSGSHGIGAILAGSKSAMTVSINTAPSSTTDTGDPGEVRFTATHIYVCIAANTWRRVAITTW